MENLIKKWRPILQSVNVEEDSQFMVAQCCENTYQYMMSHNIINFDEQGIGTKQASDQNKKFIATHTIPILVKGIKDLNIYKLVDVKPMDGPISFIYPIVQEDPTYRQVVEAFTAKLLLRYVPVYYGNTLSIYDEDTLSIYDANTLAGLVGSRLESLILTMIKKNLQAAFCSNINRDDIGSIGKLEDYGVVVVSNGMAERILSDYEYKNDTNQVLCHAGNISDKTTIIIDNSENNDYDIVGNPGNGSITYCPYLPIMMDVCNSGTSIKEIHVMSRFGMLYHELDKNYKMYKVNDYA